MSHSCQLSNGRLQNSHFTLFINLLNDLLNDLFIYYFNFSFRHLTDLYVVRSLKK